jgi:D-alanyl-D-alanine dipeptidase
MSLVVVEGWRSMEHQKHSWDSKWSIFKKKNPDWTDDEIDKAVRLIVARPHPLANHHCGGAIDVVLANKETAELIEMGTPYTHEQMSADIARLFPMFQDGIEPLARENRKILREAMQKAGFVYYPGEWWHYCFGDRMWAVYTNQKECIYGPIEPN